MCPSWNKLVTNIVFVKTSVMTEEYFSFKKILLHSIWFFRLAGEAPLPGGRSRWRSLNAWLRSGTRSRKQGKTPPRNRNWPIGENWSLIFQLFFCPVFFDKHWNLFYIKRGNKLRTEQIKNMFFVDGCLRWLLMLFL